MLKQISFAFFEDSCIFCLHHVIDKSGDFFSFNTVKRIAYTDVELETVCATKVVFFSQDMKGKPSLDVLFLCFGKSKLGRPLAVKAFILSLDTGFSDTSCQFTAVHHLNSLEFKETGTGHIGGDNVLRKL